MPDADTDEAALRARCVQILSSFALGALSAEVALMELLIASEDVAYVAALVAAAKGPRASLLQRVFAENRAGCEQVATLLRHEPLPPTDTACSEAQLAAVRALFDGLVTQSEEASVAFYSLGNPQILASATSEVVALLESWRLLRAETRAIDLGCGIGRLALALAPRVARLDGLDLSPAMVKAARRRCHDHANVFIAHTDGRDLSMFEDGSRDLVVALDSFPYVVHAGMALAQQLFAEVARVLVPGGVFALFNFSYRGDLTRDGEDVARLCEGAGLAAEVVAEQPFSLWNGSAFRLRRR